MCVYKGKYLSARKDEKGGGGEGFDLWFLELELKVDSDWIER